MALVICMHCTTEEEGRKESTRCIEEGRAGWDGLADGSKRAHLLSDRSSLNVHIAPTISIFKPSACPPVSSSPLCFVSARPLCPGERTVEVRSTPVRHHCVHLTFLRATLSLGLPSLALNDVVISPSSNQSRLLRVSSNRPPSPSREPVRPLRSTSPHLACPPHPPAHPYSLFSLFSLHRLSRRQTTSRWQDCRQDDRQDPPWQDDCRQV